MRSNSETILSVAAAACVAGVSGRTGGKIPSEALAISQLRNGGFPAPLSESFFASSPSETDGIYLEESAVSPKHENRTDCFPASRIRTADQRYAGESRRTSAFLNQSVDLKHRQFLRIPQTSRSTARSGRQKVVRPTCAPSANSRSGRKRSRSRARLPAAKS